MPAWLGSGVGALFRACRWLPLAVSSGWVGRKITSSYEDANPVLGIHPHDLITPQTLLLCTIPLGVGLQHEFVGWGHKHLVHSRSLGMRGQDPPAPGPEQGWKLGLPLSRRRWRGAVGSRLSPQQPAFSGAHVGAGAAAGRGRSLGRGQCCGMRQGTVPPRGDEHVPGAWGGRCAGGHSPPAPPGSLLAVLGQRLGGLG